MTCACDVIDDGKESARIVLEVLITAVNEDFRKRRTLESFQNDQIQIVRLGADGKDTHGS